MPYRVEEVVTGSQRKEFLVFPGKLYRGDPHWVCPLHNEVEAVFSPERNPAFRNGEAARWLLLNDKGITAGRVAAFIDHTRSRAYGQPTGGMGYFEVVNDREAAFMLFDAAKEWLAARGMEAMDGPINFGESDANWGLLVEGFMQQGFGIPYNKEYYRKFFEEYGFRKYFEQYSYHREVRGSDSSIVMFPDRLVKIAEWTAKRPGYEFRHFEFADSDRYVNDLVEVYNDTWAVYKDDFTPLDPEFVREKLRKSKAFMDEELVWFAYFKGRPVAFFILYPDLNQILKYFNGKMHAWNIIRFFWFKAIKKMTRARAIVGGVKPSHQNSGLESAIFLQLYNVFRRKTWYKELELSWVGDFNPRMMAIYEALGAKKAKTHFTYRYMINPGLPFMSYKEEMARKVRAKGDAD